MSKHQRHSTGILDPRRESMYGIFYQHLGRFFGKVIIGKYTMNHWVIGYVLVWFTFFYPTLGRWSILTNLFQVGWTYHLLVTQIVPIIDDKLWHVQFSLPGELSWTLLTSITVRGGYISLVKCWKGRTKVLFVFEAGISTLLQKVGVRRPCPLKRNISDYLISNPRVVEKMFLFA